MTTVVDTNIVFSALLNTDSLIASILFNPTTTGFFIPWISLSMRSLIERKSSSSILNYPPTN